MQQLMLHEKLYPISRIDETSYSETVYERLRKIELFKKMSNEGCSRKTICESLQVSQATLYRWQKNYKKYGLSGLEDESKRPNNVRKKTWKQHAVRKIEELRRKNPLYGKQKIAVLLKRDHMTYVSISTVGRIIQYLIARNRIQPASFYFKKRNVRPRVFNNHAQRWKQGMKSKKPGELFQIDHMTVSIIAGHQVKHFQGTCPVSKIVVEQVYSSATSATAKKFLDYAREQLPFDILSVQVDGGSEFKKDFEQACKTYNIPLYVLPPRSPKYNGNVERANGAAKYEFYTFYSGKLSLAHVRRALAKYVHKYNHYRPHQALQYLTPWQYYNGHIYEA